MDIQASWPWLALLLLGAWHGINPGMGWLFAVALGHGLAIAAAILAGGLVGLVIPVRYLKWLVAVMLVGFGLYRLVRHQHPRWGGCGLVSGISPCGPCSWPRLMGQG